MPVARWRAVAGHSYTVAWDNGPLLTQSASDTAFPARRHVIGPAACTRTSRLIVAARSWQGTIGLPLRRW